MPGDAHQTTPTPYGYWDCDCGRECHVKLALPDCRAEWVAKPAPTGAPQATRTLAEIQADIQTNDMALDALLSAVKSGALRPDRTWRISSQGVIARGDRLRAEREAAHAR